MVLRCTGPTDSARSSEDRGRTSGMRCRSPGAGKVDTFMRRRRLELQASGTLKLAKRVEYSKPRSSVRIKAEPEFGERLGLIAQRAVDDQRDRRPELPPRASAGTSASQLP